jgi:hypothetical protein
LFAAYNSQFAFGNFYYPPTVVRNAYRGEEKMALTIYQKSVYLIIFNATMISRSIGKNIKAGKSVKDFKIKVFEKLEMLTN